VGLHFSRIFYPSIKKEKSEGYGRQSTPAWNNAKKIAEKALAMSLGAADTTAKHCDFESAE
jgi:hypothetical protein